MQISALIKKCKISDNIRMKKLFLLLMILYSAHSTDPNKINRWHLQEQSYKYVSQLLEREMSMQEQVFIRKQHATFLSMQRYFATNQQNQSENIYIQRLFNWFDIESVKNILQFSKILSEQMQSVTEKIDLNTVPAIELGSTDQLEKLKYIINYLNGTLNISRKAGGIFKAITTIHFGQIANIEIEYDLQCSIKDLQFTNCNINNLVCNKITRMEFDNF